MKVSTIDPPLLGWPSADTIDFFKGVRQSVPWTDAFNNEFRRSLGFTQPVPGVRQSASLNGEWEYSLTPVTTAAPMPPPADAQWQTIRVPFLNGYYDRNPLPHAMYLRRKATIPRDGQPQTWRLLIESVMDEATVYVNGKKVGNVRGVRTPLSGRRHPGTSAWRQRDPAGASRWAGEHGPRLRQPEEPDPRPKLPRSPRHRLCGELRRLGRSAALLAAGDGGGPACQYVRSQETGDGRFPRGQSRARRPKAPDQGQRPRRGQAGLEVGQETVELAAGADKKVQLSAPWANPVYWGPDSPKLYTMVIETADASTGERLDLLRERFGFRECWIENGRFVFNGGTVRLKGSNCQGGGGLVGSGRRTMDAQLGRHGGLSR